MWVGRIGAKGYQGTKGYPVRTQRTVDSLYLAGNLQLCHTGANQLFEFRHSQIVNPGGFPHFFLFLKVFLPPYCGKTA